MRAEHVLYAADVQLEPEPEPALSGSSPEECTRRPLLVLDRLVGLCLYFEACMHDWIFQYEFLYSCARDVLRYSRGHACADMQAILKKMDTMQKRQRRLQGMVGVLVLLPTNAPHLRVYIDSILPSLG